MVDEELRIHLTAALQKVMKTRAPTSAYGVLVKSAEQDSLVDIDVEVLESQDDGIHHFFIQFRRERAQEESSEQEALVHAEVHGDQYSRISELEHELKLTKESLQATVEELQTSNEELQSANEELQAANEELQSSNEELHSVNEELHSVNSEYETKNRELLELNQDHDRLLSSLDIGTVFLDKHGRIRKFNPAIQDFFKLLVQDIGRPLEHIAYTLGNREDLLADVQRASAEGEMIEREIPVGDRLWSWMRIMPFFSRDKEVDGVVLTFTNVSQMKQAELDAAAARDRAEAANSARLRFLATVSHELRTPLNGMIGSLELLGETSLNGDQQELLRTADSSGRHLSILIDDVLDYASIEQGVAGISLNNGCYDLIEAIDSVATMVAEQAYIKGLSFDCLLDPDLPECIGGDRTRTMQLLSNLLNNAVKYTNLGYVRLSAKRVDEHYWEFTVADSGVGISSEDQEKIFIPFQQLQNGRSYKIPGVGLGLSICQHLIQRMQGDIKLVSEVGRGTMFTVRLPLYADDSLRQKCQEAASVQAQQKLSSPAGGQVFVAGDIPDYVGIAEVAQACGAMLKTTDSLANLRILQQQADDLAAAISVIDLSLVDGNWDDITAALPCAADSVYCLIPHGAQSQCLSSGIHNFIARPVRRQVLSRILHEHLLAPTRAGDDGDGGADRQYSLLVVEDNRVNQQLLLRQLESMGHAVPQFVVMAERPLSTLVKNRLI